MFSGKKTALNQLFWLGCHIFLKKILEKGSQKSFPVVAMKLATSSFTWLPLYFNKLAPQSCHVWMWKALWLVPIMYKLSQGVLAIPNVPVSSEGSWFRSKRPHISTLSLRNRVIPHQIFNNVLLIAILISPLVCSSCFLFSSKWQRFSFFLYGCYTTDCCNFMMKKFKTLACGGQWKYCHFFSFRYSSIWLANTLLMKCMQKH